MKLRTDGITWQEIDGELVILDMETSSYLTTNTAGAMLAKLLTDDLELDDLAQGLVDTFHIDPTTAHTDAQAFVDELQAKQLLA